MGNLLGRIGNRLRMTAADFRADCRFSLRFAGWRMCANLCGRVGMNAVARYANGKKDAFITGYLKKNLASVVERYADDRDCGTPVPDGPIWVCWWSGEDTAPLLVKQCIKSIRKNAGNHPVHLINRDNYRQYLEIPTFILENVEKKTMGTAHLADFIRVSLLARYGGLWLDATMFCGNCVPESCFTEPLFTCKGPVRPSGYVSNYRWVTFCLGGWKGNVMFRFLADAFACYWEKSSSAVDYLFFDHIILMAYKNIPEIRRLIDAVPENNIHRDDLQAAMNGAVSAEKWNEIVRPDTVFYKLSWRESYCSTTAEGKESVYGYFLRRDTKEEDE